MSKFKSKADKSFETKVQHYIKQGNWERVEEVTKQYEAHLKLIEPLCEYDLQFTDEAGEVLICKHHGSATRYADESDPHRPCLVIDPHVPELVLVDAAPEPTVEAVVAVVAAEPTLDLPRRQWPWSKS